jgi:ELWxxDGT repeat protein
LVPRLVRDVDQTTYAGSSSPRQVSGLRRGFAFTAFGNRELWFYDGTEDDFSLGLREPEIRQLIDGIYAAREKSGGWTLWAADGWPYFHAEPITTRPLGRIGPAYQDPSGYGIWLFEGDAGKGRGLWSLFSDPATAVEVARPLPLPDGLLVHGMTAYRGRSYFVARDRHLGTALWATDGTAAGTAPFFAPEPALVSGHPVPMILVGWVRSRLLLAVSGSTPSLWLSDGTPRGTHRLAEIGHGGRGAGITDAAQIPFTSRAVFVADDGRHGRQLWGTNGTAAGTRRLTSFTAADPFAGSPLSKTTFAGRLAFFADDGIHGRELWSTDGTPAGTHLLADACPGACGTAGEILVTLPLSGTQPERLLFSVHAAGRGVELWATDGTAAGTGPLASLCSGPCAGDTRDFADGSFPAPGSGVTFTAATPEGERALWFTDGTAAGTWRLTPPGATVTSTNPLAVSDADFGDEFWETDGTPAGTHLWRDLMRERDSGSHPTFLGTAGDTGDRVVFSAFTPARGVRLYASDGTAAGTRPLALPTPAPDLGVLAQSATAAGRTIFTAWAQGTQKAALWAADGTAAVRLTPPGVTVSGGPFTAGPHAVFFGTDVEHGSEPWVTDGTPESTHLLADLVPGVEPSSDGGEARTLHGQLVFGDWDDPQRWITDGTPEGTRLLLDAYPFLAPSRNVQVPLLAEAAGKLFFTGAGTPGGPVEVWISDWTAAGTRSLGFPDAGRPVGALFPAGERLFAALSSTDPGTPEIWVLDPAAGTAAQVPLAADFSFGLLPPTACGDRLVFNDAAGRLLATDGTPAGTFVLRDPAGQEIVLLTDSRAISFAGRLVVSGALALGTDWLSPCYVWDGRGDTAVPAPGVLCNGDFFAAGSRLYFTGFEPRTGAEPWLFEER